MFGQDDLSRSFPVPNILWFCDHRHPQKSKDLAQKRRHSKAYVNKQKITVQGVEFKPNFTAYWVNYSQNLACSCKECLISKNFEMIWGEQRWSKATFTIQFQVVSSYRDYNSQKVRITIPPFWGGKWSFKWKNRDIFALRLFFQQIETNSVSESRSNSLSGVIQEVSNVVPKNFLT